MSYSQDKQADRRVEMTPDPLDGYFRAHLETCDGCRTATESELGAQKLLSHAAMLDLFQEPAFQEAVTRIENFSFGEKLSRIDENRDDEGASPTADVGAKIGSYRLLEQIGCGGMGRVYRAVHVELNKIVAIKLLTGRRTTNTNANERFRREMQTLGRVSHPHVVSATDGGACNGHLFLVMEYVDGLDLDAIVSRLGPLSPPDAAEVMRQAALGVEAIHRHKLVHRDIKPSNIMLARDGSVKVLDLGLSKIGFPSGMQDDLTEEGQILGTRRFMAPEQFRTSDVDSRADIYSLGATLWFLVMGKPPSAVETNGLTGDTSAQSDLAEADVLQVNVSLTEILKRFTAHSIADRPSSVGDLVRAIEPLCQGSDLRGLLTRAADVSNHRLATPGAREHHNGTPRPADAGEKPRGWLLWGGITFAAIVAGIWTATQSIGRNSTPTTGKSSGIDKSNLKETEKSQIPQSIPAKKIQWDLERDIARWVLSKGGEIERHPHGQIRHQSEIPADEPFRIRNITLIKRGLVNDDLVRFRNLSMIDSLVIPENSELTDRGLEVVSRIKTLKWLYVGGSKITDGGLPALNRLPKLESLAIGSTAIGNTGLAALKEFTHLRELQLNETRVTDQGLQHFNKFPNLRKLDLASTKITDAGLLDLSTKVKRLQKLNLSYTKITDAGIRHLESLHNLEQLTLTETAVSPAGIQTLRQKLKSCKITF